MSAVYALCGSVGGALAGVGFFLLGFPLATFILAYVAGATLSIIFAVLLAALMTPPCEDETISLHYDP